MRRPKRKTRLAWLILLLRLKEMVFGQIGLREESKTENKTHLVDSATQSMFQVCAVKF